MAHRIALVCFEAGVDAPNVAVALRAHLERRGFDALVGLPSDEASAKSWQLSMVLHSTLRPAVEAFDAATTLGEVGVAGSQVKLVKTWVFDD